MHRLFARTKHGDFDYTNRDKDLVVLYRTGQYTPPRAETTSQVDKRICDFVESLFATYKNKVGFESSSHKQ